MYFPFPDLPEESRSLPFPSPAVSLALSLFVLTEFSAQFLSVSRTVFQFLYPAFFSQTAFRSLYRLFSSRSVSLSPSFLSVSQYLSVAFRSAHRLLSPAQPGHPLLRCRLSSLLPFQPKQQGPVPSQALMLPQIRFLIHSLSQTRSLFPFQIPSPFLFRLLPQLLRFRQKSALSLFLWNRSRIPSA